MEEIKEAREKFTLPTIDELNQGLKEKEQKDSYGNVNTMARKKLTRKVRLFNIHSRIESEKKLDFDDLKVGDNFCMYDYSGEPVLCSGQRIMRLNEIRRKNDGGIILDIIPIVLH